MVTIDCGALAGMFNPLAGSSHSSVGLTAEEVLEIAYIAGSHPNVRLLPPPSVVHMSFFGANSLYTLMVNRWRWWR